MKPGLPSSVPNVSGTFPGPRHTRPTTAQRARTTALLFLLVPALVFDRDGRGLHDRYSDTAVVRG